MEEGLEVAAVHSSSRILLGTAFGKERGEVRKVSSEESAVFGACGVPSERHKKGSRNKGVMDFDRASFCVGGYFCCALLHFVWAVALHYLSSCEWEPKRPSKTQASRDDFTNLKDV